MRGENDVDLTWFRIHLEQDIPRPCLERATTPEGIFPPHLKRAWNRIPGERSTGTTVSPGPLVSNLAIGHAEYLHAARKGADSLLDAFRDEEAGGWYARIDPDVGVGAHRGSERKTDYHAARMCAEAWLLGR